MHAYLPLPLFGTYLFMFSSLLQDESVDAVVGVGAVRPQLGSECARHEPFGTH